MSKHPSHERDEAILDLLDGNLPEQGQADLRAWLDESVAHWERFAELSFIHSQVADQLHNQRSADGVRLDAISSVPSAPEDPFPPIQLPPPQSLTKHQYASALSYVLRHTFTPKRIAAMATAAVLLFGLVLTIVMLSGPGDNETANPDLVIWPDESPDPTPPLSPAVATITDTVAALWEGTRLSQGDRLYTGQSFTLTRGVAMLRFENQAEVILQAPSRIELVSDSAIRLTSGRLVGRCETPSSKGFTVHASDARIVDIGTEFGVALDAAGTVHTHVFDGVVSFLSLETGQAIQLQAGEAVVTRGDQLKRSASDPQAFVRANDYQTLAAAEASGDERGLVSQFLLSQDPDVLAYYVFDDRDRAEGKLINRAAATQGRLDATLGADWGVKPIWQEGLSPGRHALAFGHDEALVSRVASIDHDEALQLGDELTLIAWVYWDGTSFLNGTLLSKREPIASGRRMTFQFSLINGTIQLGVGDDAQHKRAFVYSDEYAGLLKAGWNQVAATADGKTIRYYLNGQHLSNRPQPFPLMNNTSPLLIGTSAPDLDPILAPKPDPLQGGYIGEVLISKRIFSAREINEHFESFNRSR